MKRENEKRGQGRYGREEKGQRQGREREVSHRGRESLQTSYRKQNLSSLVKP